MSALQEFDPVPGATAETVSIGRPAWIVLRYLTGTGWHYATYDLTAFQKKHVFTKVYADSSSRSWMSARPFGLTACGWSSLQVQGTATVAA